MSGYAGQQDPFSAGSDFNAHAFLIHQVLGMVATSALVVVKAVRASGIAAVGQLDVQPLVHQTDINGTTTPHGIIHNLPYFRLQGGTNAVVIDPAVGDVGIAVFASRDISTVKNTKAPGPPGSRRRFDWADGLYIGGVLNGPPTQYVQFTAEGINIVSPGTVTIRAAAVAVNP